MARRTSATPEIAAAFEQVKQALSARVGDLQRKSRAGPAAMDREIGRAWHTFECVIDEVWTDWREGRITT